MNHLSMIEKIRDEDYEISVDEMEDWIWTDPDCLSRYHDDPSGQLPLHVACRNTGLWSSRRFSVVEWMVERYPNAASVQDNNGNFPLHLSAKEGVILPRTVSRLLDAHPGALETPNNSGDLPLHLAFSSFHKNPEIQTLLLDRYPVACSRKNDDGNLPLHRLCMKNPFLMDPFSTDQQRVLESCLDAYPEGLLERNNDHYLPIECLTFGLSGTTPQGMDFLRLLVGRNPECVRSRNIHGRLPLHNAFKMDYAVVKFLLDQYPEGASVRDNSGQLPLHSFCYAIRSTCESGTLQLLIEQSPQALSAADDDGLLPLECFWARPEDGEYMTQTRLKYRWEDVAEPFRFLLTQSDQALGVKDHSGKLSLHRLCQSGKEVPVEALQALVDAYPDSAQVLDGMGNLPLFYLCENEEEFGLVDYSSEEEEEEETSMENSANSLDAIYYLVKRSLPFLGTTGNSHHL